MSRRNDAATRPGASSGGSPASPTPPRPTTRTLHTERGRDGQVTSRTRRTVLPSGLRIVTEEMAGARSASIGIWVGAGSRDESPTLHGCSHFLEHLLFKGTHERSALDISVAMDAVGGELNAFTAKEYTVFHARVLEEDLPLAVDVLGDMVTGSLLLPEDVEAEREVILDEIAMHEDDPDDVVHDLFAATAWGDSPLGRRIAGTTESIARLSREQILRFSRRHYRPERIVVAAAGALDHAAVVRQVRRAFGRHGFLDAPAEPAPVETTSRTRRTHSGAAAADRSLEQVNLVLGVGGLTRSDDRRFALGVLNAALGGGTSSRLFQEVRERRGLAYSVYSFAHHYRDAGLFGVSVGCLPAKLDDVLATVRAELARVAADGLRDEEVAWGQGQLRGGLVLGLEDPGARMSRLGKGELVHTRMLPLDEVVARIEAVTPDDVRRLAGTLLSRPEILAVVGPGVTG
ncbi:M16 family metallopeptidase [Nocardioides sp.]|uniref:M16 family metallopeptidase n=1 Tax=Nocardioides sp. TaxID=35761 RepID=UPI0035294CE6